MKRVRQEHEQDKEAMGTEETLGTIPETPWQALENITRGELRCLEFCSRLSMQT